MRYNNPILNQDYSDPDVIRYKNSYYMVSSSFNHTPGVPVLKSKNLVNWKIINYVFDSLPFEKYNNVCHGDGAWAPSLRFYNNKFYCIIPFPDEGIYISECTDIDLGDWSDLWCLIEGKGIIDPCPIWTDDKCYLACAFAKSRIGFNSCLGLYEVSLDLKKQISTTYKIIYDGHNNNPTIEGPKFYFRNKYFYIMAPAGSVKSGWQVCLRSKDIYGPYESKIVLFQDDTLVNGPHQGALIDLPNKEYAFIHFQDKGIFGRVCHLEPVKWINDWPVCGNIKDDALPGSPVDNHEYLIDKKSNYKIPLSDDFKDKYLSKIWQTPANKKPNWYYLDNGLVLNCIYHSDKAYNALKLTPNLFLTKIEKEFFSIKTEVILDLKNDGDEIGLCFMGSKYQYICVKRIDGINHLQIKQGYFNQDYDIVLYDIQYLNNEICLMAKFKDGSYSYGFNNIFFKEKYKAYPGRWIGTKYGIYARGITLGGSGKFKYFKVRG